MKVFGPRRGKLIAWRIENCCGWEEELALKVGYKRCLTAKNVWAYSKIFEQKWIFIERIHRWTNSLEAARPTRAGWSRTWRTRTWRWTSTTRATSLSWSSSSSPWSDHRCHDDHDDPQVPQHPQQQQGHPAARRDREAGKRTKKSIFNQISEKMDLFLIGERRRTDGVGEKVGQELARLAQGAREEWTAARWGKGWGNNRI